MSSALSARTSQSSFASSYRTAEEEDGSGDDRSEAASEVPPVLEQSEADQTQYETLEQQAVEVECLLRIKARFSFFFYCASRRVFFCFTAHRGAFPLSHRHPFGPYVAHPFFPYLTEIILFLIQLVDSAALQAARARIRRALEFEKSLDSFASAHGVLKGYIFQQLIRSCAHEQEEPSPHTHYPPHPAPPPPYPCPPPHPLPPPLTAPQAHPM